MGGSTLELVFLALFGLVTLVQFLRNFLRRKAAEARQAQDALNPQNVQAGALASASAERLSTSWGRDAEEDAVPVGPPVPHALAPSTQLPRTPVRPRPTAAPAQAGTANAPLAQNAPYPMRRARRFSRAALMGDRRAVQDAVVIAAILRPCHAHKPYGTDG